MFSITNPKVAGFAPRWANFRGFTILFNNPGASFADDGPRRLVAADPTIDFYAGLREELAALDPDLLTRTYLFCPLPPPTYHVTVCDGGNDANLASIPLDRRGDLATFLDGLPDSLAHPNPLLDIAAQSDLVRDPWPLRFRFDRLVLWSHTALVATLTPADQEADAEYEWFLTARRALNTQFRDGYGFAASERFVPHVTLGYFANREGAQLALPMVGAWQERFAAALAGRSITFEAASLYGFTDLISFFTLASPE